MFKKRTPQRTEVPVNFLILSDTHSVAPAFAELSAKAEAYPSTDVVIHCGDLTDVGALEEYQHALDMLKVIPAELKLVIAGNHDVSLDEDYCRLNNKRNVTLGDHKKAKMFWTEHASTFGVHYLEEGLHTFALKSGATFTVYASPYQPACGEWGFGYPHKVDRFNPPLESPLSRLLPSMFGTASSPLPANPIPDIPCVDIMLTHGPPYGTLDKTRLSDHRGCPHLAKAVRRAKPRLHCFGHIHEAHGAVRMTWSNISHTMDRTEEFVPSDNEGDAEDSCAKLDLTSDGPRLLQYGNETVFVNAAIRDGKDRIENKPWLVKLDLPIVESAS